MDQKKKKKKKKRAMNNNRMNLCKYYRPWREQKHKANYSFQSQVRKSGVTRVRKSGVRKSRVTKWRHPGEIDLVSIDNRKGSTCWPNMVGHLPNLRTGPDGARWNLIDKYTKGWGQNKYCIGFNSHPCPYRMLEQGVKTLVWKMI